jgi:hypothetical protein
VPPQRVPPPQRVLPPQRVEITPARTFDLIFIGHSFLKCAQERFIQTTPCRLNSQCDHVAQATEPQKKMPPKKPPLADGVVCSSLSHLKLACPTMSYRHARLRISILTAASANVHSIPKTMLFQYSVRTRTIILYKKYTRPRRLSIASTSESKPCRRNVCRHRNVCCRRNGLIPQCQRGYLI